MDKKMFCLKYVLSMGLRFSGSGPTIYPTGRASAVGPTGSHSRKVIAVSLTELFCLKDTKT